MTQKILIPILVLFVLILGGCKIKYSLSGASVGNAKTYSVDFFRNMAELVYPSLSQNFTTAVKDKFMADTNLSLVSQEGDLHFEGEITSYRNEPVTINADEQASSFRLTIVVKVRFTNETDNKFDFDKSFTRFATYTDDNFAAVEASLVEQITEELVDDIFKESVVNW